MLDLLVPAGGRGPASAPRPSSVAGGAESPVLHVDSDRPLRDNAGELVDKGPWGIYVKPDRESVQGGAQPLPMGHKLDLDPYPPGTGAARKHSRTCGARPSRTAWSASRVAAGATSRSARAGPGAFTAGQLPIFDQMLPNVLRRRRLQPRLQDDRGRPREISRVLQGEHSTSCIHSASSASPRAICTRSRRARTRGAETRLPRRRRRGSARALGRMASRRARRRGGGVGEGAAGLPAPRAWPGGSSAISIARRRSPR